MASSQVTVRPSAPSASDPGTGSSGESSTARGAARSAAGALACGSATSDRAPISPSIRATRAAGPCVIQTSWGNDGPPLPRSRRTARAASRSRRAFAGEGSSASSRSAASPRRRSSAARSSRFPRGEEEAGEGRRRRLELSRNDLRDARTLHPFGERQPEDGLLPERQQARSGDGKARAQRFPPSRAPHFRKRRFRVLRNVVEHAAEGRPFVRANAAARFRIEDLNEGDAVRGRSALRREALGDFAEKRPSAPGRRPSLRSEARGTPREERRREREARRRPRDSGRRRRGSACLPGPSAKSDSPERNRGEHGRDHRDVPLAMRLPTSGARMSAVRFGITMTCTLSPSFSARVFWTQVGFA